MKAAFQIVKVVSLRSCSREFIRAAYGDPYMPVPSPTYLLQNIYDEAEGNRPPGFALGRLKAMFNEPWWNALPAECLAVILKLRQNRAKINTHLRLHRRADPSLRPVPAEPAGGPAARRLGELGDKRCVPRGVA